MTKHIFKAGKRFGRLIVISKEKVPGWGTRWKCRCDCGNETMVIPHNLAAGTSRSCGCLALERRTTHGLTKSRVYTIWKGMHQRCENAKNFAYHNYGGRGIKIDPRWESFENFLEDMGHPPKGMTIERKDNNGDYCKENCHWATYKEQLNNTRNNRMLTVFGKTQSLTLWAEEYGLRHGTLRNRLFRSNMTPEQALTIGKYWQQKQKRT